MDRRRSEVQNPSHSGEESFYLQFPEEAQNFEDPPPSYEVAQLSVQQRKINNPGIRVRSAKPQMHVVMVDCPEHEPEVEDYICACLLPTWFVAVKRGLCSVDVWINIFIGNICGWPMNAFHAMTMLHEPDNGDSLQTVVTLAPGPNPSSRIPNKETITIQIPIPKK